MIATCWRTTTTTTSYHLMLQDDDMLVNQPDQQHNLQQDNTAYNRRQCDNQVMSQSDRWASTDVSPPQGPQNEPQGPEQVLYYQHNTLTQQVVNLDDELRNLVKETMPQLRKSSRKSFRLSEPWVMCPRHWSICRGPRRRPKSK